MEYTFSTKFTEIQLDDFVSKVYSEFKRDSSQKFIFDLSITEWISNQELLVFTGFLKYFVEKKVDFEVKLFESGTYGFYENLNDRVVKRIIQLWDIWQIYSICDQKDIKKYFGIDGRFVNELKKNVKYKESKESQIYQRYGITPFITLNSLKSYNDNQIEKKVEGDLTEFLNLNSALSDIVSSYDCKHPFDKKTISYVIAKELYENFLDHCISNSFGIESSYAFMSSSVLPKKLNFGKNEEEIKKRNIEIQSNLELNVKSEQILETYPFFYNSETKRYKNESYVQYSFLDFGLGIPATLREHYKESKYNETNLSPSDSDILKYAFTYFGSRLPIYEKIEDKEIPIPRGLFDVLSIVKRYNGLIIIRSNFGKILYDFSNEKLVQEAFSCFGNESSFFPGTLISIYLPSFSNEKIFDSTAIKSISRPNIDFITLRTSFRNSEKVYFSLFSLIDKFKNVDKKNNLYREILLKLKTEINSSVKTKIIYFSFLGWDIDKRLTRKVLFFLLSDYEINIYNNIVITYPPDKDFVDSIKNELINLSEVVKNYKIHPLPLFLRNEETNDFEINWLGVFNGNDEDKLTNILLDDVNLVKDDFQDPNGIIGHIFTFDKNGNLVSFLPSKESLENYFMGEVLDYYELKEAEKFKDFSFIEHSSVENEEKFESLNEEIEESRYDKLLEKSIESKKEFGEIFFTSGNYYQYDFVDVTGLVNRRLNCDILSKELFFELSKRIDKIHEYLFISLNSNSQKILESIREQFQIVGDKCLYFNSLSNIEEQKDFVKLGSGKRAILICDVFASGLKTKQFELVLNNYDVGLELLGVIVDVNDCDGKYIPSEKIISLKKHLITKYTFEQIKDKINDLKVIRVNPFTNIPIKFKLEKTLYKESVIFEKNEEFLSFINEENIDIGLLKFNQIIHPYFFNTKKILQQDNKELLRKLFSRIPKEIRYNIFYPKGSDIFELAKRQVQFNEVVFETQTSATFFELERIGTNDGWKFPHAEFLEADIIGKLAILFDDGSCTGNSLFQMINEISFFLPSEIILICIIGRVQDFHREFFSRVRNITALDENGNSVDIPIKIIFGSIWNIPTYFLDDNPFKKEKDWIKKVLSINNLPHGLKIIGNVIYEKVKINEKEGFENYAFFPKNIFDFKKLMIVRNEIGKVIGYRFYEESFTYFNSIVKSDPLNSNYLFTIELEYICSLLIYEIDLFNKLRIVVPDIERLLILFVDKIILSNSISLSNLNFEWKRKDIIYLFFTFNSVDVILKKLSIDDNLNHFFLFFGNKNTNCDYFLYRLLNFIPLDKDELNNKKSTQIIKFIETLIQNDSIPKVFISNFKIFQSFISSLPTEGDFEDKLNEICIAYRNIKDKEKHNDSIGKCYDLTRSNIRILEKGYSEHIKNRMLTEWDKIKELIEKILSFSSTYSSFFLLDYISLEGQEASSLRQIHKYLNSGLAEISPKSDFLKIDHTLVKLYSLFIESDCKLFKIFTKRTTKRFNELVVNKLLPFQPTIIGNENFQIDFPFSYTSYVFDEIFKNLRHRKEGGSFKIEFIKKDLWLNLIIENEIDFEKSSDGQNGISDLKKLNNYPLGLVKYEEPLIFDNIFRQSLFFKLI